jgi:hypothetical protein
LAQLAPPIDRGMITLGDGLIHITMLENASSVRYMVTR